MRVLIYGAGAVGGYFGGRLLEGGADVTFLARGAQLAALAERGIRLNSIDGDFASPVTAVGALTDAPPPDLVLLCVKSHDTAAAADDLKAHLPEGALVLSLQNGVEHMDLLTEKLGASRILGGTVFIGTRVASPGVIEHSAAGFVRIGRYPSGMDGEVHKVVEFLEAHGVEATESDAIRLDLWKKLLWNVAFNGPSAMSRTTVGRMVKRSGLAWLIKGLIHEAATTGRADGVPLGVGIEDKTFDQTQGLADFKTSMLQDVEAGRPIENEALYGFVSRTANRHGVDVALTRMVYDVLSELFRTTGQDDQPEK